MNARAIRSALVAAVLLVGCEEALLDALPEAPGEPRVVAVGGAELVAVVGGGPAALRVRVLDAEGRPVRAAVVRYVLLDGSGAFSAATTVTDDQGLTAVEFLPLAGGTAVVEAVTERPGGVGRAVFTILVFSDPSEAASLAVVSGDGQTGPAGGPVPAALVVRVENPDGLPVDGHGVTFAIESAAGPGAGLAATSAGAPAGEVGVATDEAGLARAYLTLGEVAGPYRVVARAVVGPASSSTTATVAFTATALPPPTAEIVVVAGQGQTAVIDRVHAPESPDYLGREPNPFVVRAIDAFGRPVAGAGVRWFVSDGGGTLASAVTITDSGGLATNRLFEVSEGRNAAVAVADGAAPVEFVVQAIVVVEAEE